MHHDRHGKTEASAFSSSFVDELRLIADAQRLRSEYIGQWVRRWFAGAKVSRTEDRVSPAGGFRPQRS
jgi:hypothetical protein